MNRSRLVHHSRTRIARGALVLAALAAVGGCGSGAASGHRAAVSTGPTSSTQAIGGAGPTAKLGTGSTSHTIEESGTTRTYRTYVPSGLEAIRAVPLVVMLHGGFGSSEQAESAHGWDAKADAEGFVVAYPNGDGKAWNAGTCCGAPARNGVDDVGFVTDVVHAVQGQVSIDPRRIFVTGMSNGAMMAERLACETNLFAAAASVAGAQMVRCDGAHPISMLHIYGSADDHVPPDGSSGKGIGKVPTHPPVATSIAQWRSRDDCEPPKMTVQGAVTTSTASCAAGRAVTLVAVAGAGHQWPGAHVSKPRIRKLLGMDPPSTALDATATIWSFFAAHPAP